jgi:hypothetical protein
MRAVANCVQNLTGIDRLIMDTYRSLREHMGLRFNGYSAQFGLEGHSGLTRKSIVGSTGKVANI